jgi:CRP/FNR family transcriptional regulator, anaerobic regulatory protein
MSLYVVWRLNTFTTSQRRMNSQPEDFKPELFLKIFGEEAAVSLYAEFKANSEFLLGEEGDLIFEKGGTPENVFLILDGYLRLQVKNSSAEEVILQFFGTGDLAGIIDLMQMRTYRATAVVHSKNIQLCVINKKSFLKILSKQPQLALRLIQQMDKDTADIESRAAVMNSQKVTSRISGAIRVLESKFGKNEQGEINIEISPSHIAKMVGATRTSVYRSMKKLQDLGELRFEQHKIIIPC